MWCQVDLPVARNRRAHRRNPAPAPLVQTRSPDRAPTITRSLRLDGFCHPPRQGQIAITRGDFKCNAEQASGRAAALPVDGPSPNFRRPASPYSSKPDLLSWWCEQPSRVARPDPEPTLEAQGGLVPGFGDGARMCARPLRSTSEGTPHHKASFCQPRSGWCNRVFDGGSLRPRQLNYRSRIAA